MKSNSRMFICGFLYVVALFFFLGAIAATGRGSMLDFSNLARIIFCSLAVVCVVAAAIFWKTTDAQGKRNKIIMMIAAIIFIIGGGFIDNFLDRNTNTHEYTADMYRIKESAVARFETADGKSIIVDSEISLLASLAELEIQEAPLTPADDPEDWIYRITYNPIDKVPNGEEIVVYVHEKYLKIGSEYYLPIGKSNYDSILEWFIGKEAYFLGKQ